MLSSRELIKFFILLLLILGIYAAPITPQQESNALATTTRTVSRPYQTTTTAVVYHKSYTTIYIGVTAREGRPISDIECAIEVLRF